MTINYPSSSKANKSTIEDPGEAGVINATFMSYWKEGSNRTSWRNFRLISCDLLPDGDYKVIYITLLVCHDENVLQQKFIVG